MNTMMLLEAAAQEFGDRVAFVNGEQTLTFAQLFDAAGQGAQVLAESDCAHAAMLDVSSFAFPIALYAAAWAGIPFVPINYRLAQEQVGALLERIAPSYLVIDEERAESFSARKGVTPVVRDSFIEQVRTGNKDASASWSMDPEEVAVLLFTSGTTGEPKAAVLRHKHLVSYILGAVEFGSGVDETLLVTVPPYHIAGVISVLSAVYAGRKVVQLANFNARKWIDLARREEVTTAFLVPTMLRQVVQALEEEGAANMPHLKGIAYGGGKMPLAVIEKAMALLPETDFTQAYGLTETASTVSVLLPKYHREALASDDPAVRRRLTSVGRALPGIEVQIRDEAGNALLPGQHGEIFIRGEQVAGEYVGKGSVLDADHWFPTRDGGELDDEGFLYLSGRADDVIVRGAENMSPGEIEDVLLTHPAVQDVAVVGVPDEQWGEAVAAVVVLREGEGADGQTLKNMVKSQLRSSRVPEHVHFWPELPYNETGKLLRRVVRERLGRELSKALGGEVSA